MNPTGNEGVRVFRWSDVAVTLKVCMFVYNNFNHDTRVLKEAKSLTNAGYQVTVIALLDDNSKPYEEKHGIKIIRVIKNPLNYRLLKWMRQFNPLIPVVAILYWVKQVVQKIASITKQVLNYEIFKSSRKLLQQPQSKDFSIQSCWKSEIKILQKEWHNICSIGIKEYRQEFWQGNSYFLKGLVIFSYIIYQIAYWCYYWLVPRIFWGRYLRRWFLYGIKRPIKIFWSRYVKRGFYWGVQRPIKIFWSRYVKRGFYWGVQRPIKIFWSRYVKRGFYWGIKRPIKIFWNRYVKRGFYWGVQRPIKIFWNRHLYQTIRRFLGTVHRPLCFIDYHYRSLKVVAQENADIYHAHDLNVLAAAYQATQKNGGKLVYDSHEFYVERNRQYPLNPIGKFLLSRFESFLMQRSNAVITVSDAIAKELAQRYQVPIPTVILNTPSKNRNFCKDNKKSIRLALDIDPKYYLLLYSGGITFNRGLEKIIESLVYLPDCHFVLMGYGREKYIEQLQTLALKRGVESRLSLFGPVPSEEVTTYAASADLGVAAIENVCLSYYYCAPNKLFEYICAGLPVIASDFPEMRKIVVQYDLGTTFDPSQPKDIARAAQELLKDPERLLQMRKNTSTASQIYNWENESKKLLELYQQLN